MKPTRLVNPCAAAALLVFFGCSKPAKTDNAVPTPPTAGAAAAAPALSAEPAATVITLTDATFDAQTAQGVILVDFWATWCRPCRMQGPIVETVASQIGSTARVGKLDVDAAPKTARRFEVSGIPTLIIFKDGKPVEQFVGVTQAADLVAALRKAAGAP